MVVGNGLLAKGFWKFIDSNDIVIFASGVSNSTNIDNKEFEREERLLDKTINSFPNSHIIYFSTCSIYDESENIKPYVKHKLQMEGIVAKCNKYTIFRLTNVVGFEGNQNTIFSFLVNNIRSNSTFDLWQNAYRNFIDISDVVEIISFLLNNKKSEILNGVFNIGNKYNTSVVELAKKIADRLNLPLHVNYIDKGENVKIDYLKTTELSSLFESKFESDYIEKLLNKYIKL